MAYLRDYQTNIMARIIDEWQRCKSVMVQMPTGTGKTRVLAALVNEELNDNNETTGRTRSVWIVAHRRELVEQIKETVEQFIINNSQFIINNWVGRNDVSQLANAELRFIIINLLNFLLQRYKAAKVRNEIMCKMVSYSDLKLHKPLLISQFFRILAT